MGEKVVVRQNSMLETRVWASEPAGLREVAGVHELTPYGMLLASLGSCTGVVVNTYARYHGVGLKEVELSLEYGRNFKEDCETCEGTERYEEQIDMEVSFSGGLSGGEREKLFAVSRQCPIHKMLRSGIQVVSRHRAEGERP